MKVLSFSFYISSFSVAFFLRLSTILISLLLCRHQIFILISKVNMFFFLVEFLIIIFICFLEISLIVLFFSWLFFIMSLLFFFHGSFFLTFVTIIVASTSWILSILGIKIWSWISLTSNFPNTILSFLEYFTVLMKNHNQMFDMREVIAHNLMSIYFGQIDFEIVLK